jgi:4-amino-4-deoxy-L-arabinose transferase-like glycosyltransferase
MPGRRTALAIAAAAIALLFVHAAISGCDHDEVQHLHGAWLVSQGKVPFRDFLEQRHPVIYYALAPAVRALDGSPRALIFAVRTFDLLLLVAALAVFLKLVRPLLRDRDAFWPVLLLLGSFFFARNSMEVRPDPWMAFFCLVALWQWAAYLRGGKPWHAALAGVSIGVAIVVLQKAFAFAGLLAIGTVPVALAAPDRLRRILRGGALSIAAALAPLAAGVLLLRAAGLWSEFVFWNYTFNRFYYLATQFQGPSATAVVGVSILEQPVLWLGGFVGIWLAIRRFRQLADQPELALAATVVLGILASVFQSRWPFSHNLLPAQPALAVLAVAALEELHDARWRTAARWHTAVGIVLALLVVKVAAMCFTYDEGHGNIAIEERILALTGPAEPVATAPPYHPIFRRDSFFFWYVPLNNAQAYLECCRRFGCPPGKVEHDLAAWRTDPPAAVYLPADEPTWAPVGFAAYRSAYRPTDVPGLFVRHSLPTTGSGQATSTPK